MNFEQTELKNLVERTIHKFNANENYLFLNDLSERCICARFAFYLQNEVMFFPQYQEYIVDVEYNRGAKGKDYEPKRLSDNEKPITVDLIVHKRGYNDQVYQHGMRQVIGYSNLICIEMKKSTDCRGPNSISRDKKRLKIMAAKFGDFGYTIGFMIIADIKNKALRIVDIFI